MWNELEIRHWEGGVSISDMDTGSMMMQVDSSGKR